METSSNCINGDGFLSHPIKKVVVVWQPNGSNPLNAPLQSPTTRRIFLFVMHMSRRHASILVYVFVREPG